MVIPIELDVVAFGPTATGELAQFGLLVTWCMRHMPI